MDIFQLIPNMNYTLATVIRFYGYRFLQNASANFIRLLIYLFYKKYPKAKFILS